MPFPARERVSAGRWGEATLFAVCFGRRFDQRYLPVFAMNIQSSIGIQDRARAIFGLPFDIARQEFSRGQPLRNCTYCLRPAASVTIAEA